MDNTLFAIAALIVFIIMIVLAYKVGGMQATINTLKQARADVPTLDRVEAGIDKQFSVQQLDLVRQIAFPMFALGLAITPEGGTKEAIGNAKDLFDILTDRLPNKPSAAPPPSMSPAPPAGGLVG